MWLIDDAVNCSVSKEALRVTQQGYRVNEKWNEKEKKNGWRGSLFSFRSRMYVCMYLIYTFAFQLVIHLGSLQFIFNLHTRVLMFVY